MPGIVLILRINCWAKETWFPAYILEWEIPTGIDNNTMWQSLWCGRTVYCGSRYNPHSEVGGWFFREPLREVQKERPQPVMKSWGGGFMQVGEGSQYVWGSGKEKRLDHSIIEISGGMDPRVHGVRKKGSSGNPLPSPVGLAESEDSRICEYVCFVCFLLRALDWLLQLGIWCLYFWLFFSSAAINLLFWSLARLPHFAPLPTHFVSGGLLLLYSQWTDWD